MDHQFLFFVVAGFVAQLIDGALGMAYGLSSMSLLLSFGLPPAVASASVHTAEVFTSAVSGLSHLHVGNVDTRLFRRLVLPGVVGGLLGAYALVGIPGEIIKPFVGLYLFAMGFVVVSKAFRVRVSAPSGSGVRRLGLIGGFLDAVGGGGWGAVVTSTLIAKGNPPRHVIGSVNLAEFFVTVAQSAALLLTLGLMPWKTIGGLIVGGVVAAPVAARVCRNLPAKPLMVLVGLVIITLSLRMLVRSVV
jgi:hypothetical protein